MPSSRKNSSTWQTSAKRSPTTSRIVLQAGKWHEPISHSARKGRLQPASEEADGVLLDGNGNLVRERWPGKPIGVERSPLLSWAGWRRLAGRVTPRFKTIQGFATGLAGPLSMP